MNKLREIINDRTILPSKTSDDLRKNPAMISSFLCFFLKPHSFWQILHEAITRSLKSRQKTELCAKEGFNHIIMFLVNTSSATSDLPFTSLGSAPLPLGVTLAQKSQLLLQGCFLLLICSRHARSTKIRIPAFQRTPDKRHLKQKEARWNRERRNDNAVACNDF